MSAQFVYGGIIASVRVCERKLSSVSAYTSSSYPPNRSGQCCLTENTCYIFCGLPTEQAVRSEARIDCDVAAVGAASGDDGSGDEEVENGAVRYRQDATTTCSVGSDDSDDQQMFSSSHASYMYMYSDAGNSSVMSLKGGPDSTFNDSLIREVRLNPIIYDFSHPLYGNAIKKQETWIEIAAKLNEKVEAVKTRWRTLRDRYTKERRRVMTCGVGSSFSYYADLCFLDNSCTENRIVLSKPIKSCNRSGNDRNSNNTGAHCDVATSMFVKPEVFEQSSDTSYNFDNRIADDMLMEQEETVPSSSGPERSIQRRQRIRKASHKSPTPPVSSATATAGTEIAELVSLEKVPVKRSRLDPSPDSPSDTVARALMRSVEALQRLAERKPAFDRAVGPRDADECFADFVCMSLKSIDNGSRVHARIAILHALAQFQT
ncbi:Alcohol dehydrogenase transcription factor Myb/SANT-like family protein [Brugia pahangi]